MSNKKRAARTRETPRKVRGISLDVERNSFRISHGKISQKMRKGGNVQEALRRQELRVGLEVSQLTPLLQKGSSWPHSHGRYKGSFSTLVSLTPAGSAGGVLGSVIPFEIC